jgi:hypothetical protein
LAAFLGFDQSHDCPCYSAWNVAAARGRVKRSSLVAWV